MYPEQYRAYIHTGRADLVSDIVSGVSTRNDVAVSFTFTPHDDNPELHSFHFRKHQRAQSMPKAHINGIPMMFSVYMMLCFGLKTLRSFEVLPHRLEEDVYLHR
jgi:hypothetical protein